MGFADAARFAASAASVVVLPVPACATTRTSLPRRSAAQAGGRRGKLVRVVAHAGTGKTTTLAALAANLAASAKPKEGEQPWLKLSYWTFNRSAAADAAQRFGGRTTRYGVDARSINSALLAFVQKGERDAGRDRLECPTRLPQTMEALATILDALGLGDILCGNQPVSGAPDNSSLSHFSAMTPPL